MLCTVACEFPTFTGQPFDDRNTIGLNRQRLRPSTSRTPI
jgi:hypothetical protein